MTGVAVVSITITLSSPMITPEFGSPSAVYAYALSESLMKLVFFSTVSACDAKVFSVMMPSPRGVSKRHVVARRYDFPHYL